MAVGLEGAVKHSFVVTTRVFVLHKIGVRGFFVFVVASVLHKRRRGGFVIWCLLRDERVVARVVDVIGCACYVLM